MRFKHSWRGAGETIPLAAAVEARIDDDFGSGVAERGLSTAQNAGRAIGLIVQRLHERGLLSDDDLKDFVSYNYTPVPDAEA